VGIGSSSGTIPARQSDTELMPVDAGGDLEDPASWFSDADLFGGSEPPAPQAQAADAAAPPQPPAPPPQPPRATEASDESGSWHESGLAEPSVAGAEAVEIAPPTASTPARPPALPDTGPAGDLAAELEPNDSVSPPAASASPDKGGSGKYVLMALLTVAVAAAAWLATRM
jgi:hypothetical protein